jgi:hypothetical protein
MNPIITIGAGIVLKQWFYRLKSLRARIKSLLSIAVARRAKMPRTTHSYLSPKATTEPPNVTVEIKTLLQQQPEPEVKNSIKR